MGRRRALEEKGRGRGTGKGEKGGEVSCPARETIFVLDCIKFVAHVRIAATNHQLSDTVRVNNTSNQPTRGIAVLGMCVSCVVCCLHWGLIAAASHSLSLPTPPTTVAPATAPATAPASTAPVSTTAPPTAAPPSIIAVVWMPWRRGGSRGGGCGVGPSSHTGRVNEPKEGLHLLKHLRVQVLRHFVATV